MRERHALRRAAWHELWPAAMLTIGCAFALGYSSAVGVRPASMWLGLWLVPAALFCGVACGRGTPRMLAFLLARPVRRERVFASRISVGLGVLGGAWAIVVAAVVVRDPHFGAWFDACVVGGVLVLALLCGVLGSTATDRESLAFGIATLVFASMVCVPMIGADALEVTLARTLLAQPFFVALAVVLGVLGLFRAARRTWREGLPLRDAPTIRALVTGSAGAWVVGEALMVAVVWRSASPAEAAPMIVLGASEQGLVIASGSPSGLDGTDEPRLDAIHVGIENPMVAFHIARRGIFDRERDRGEITRAAATHGRVAIEVTDHGDASACRVMLADLRGDVRELDVACGRMSVSPSGRSLAIASRTELAVVDVATDEVRMRVSTQDQREVLGWSDELPVSWTPPGTSDLFFGDAKVATVDAARGAKLSPDGRHLAVLIAKPAMTFGRDALTRAGHIDVLSLAGGERRILVDESSGAWLIGWLDADHLATVGFDREAPTATVSIIAVTSGTVIAALPSRGALPMTAIDGPPQGPWLISRGGAFVEAWDRDGSELWSEHVATFERDGSAARRWAIVDGEVVGIDPRGRWWRHPVPWEQMP